MAGAWALLTEPLSIVSEGSGLWTLFCGDAATRAGDRQPALSERLSLVETDTGIRVLLKPEPTGNVMIFLAEDAEAAHMIMQTLGGPHDFKVDGFPVPITEVVVSDYLIDGRAVPEL